MLSLVRLFGVAKPGVKPLLIVYDARHRPRRILLIRESQFTNWVLPSLKRYPEPFSSRNSLNQARLAAFTKIAV
jgi:hypothetical protein